MSWRNLVIWSMWSAIFLATAIAQSYLWVMKGAVRIIRFQFWHGYQGILAGNTSWVVLQLIAIHLIINVATFFLALKLAKKWSSAA